MSRTLSNDLLGEMFGQSSGDPFLALFELSHPDFSETIYMVNNSENIISNGNEYLAFPVSISLPVDDGETQRMLKMEFDNVSLFLIEELRSITSPISVKIDFVLASIPDNPEITLEDLRLTRIGYTKNKVSGDLYQDDFLSTELSSESYTPSNFPGIF